jgi:hypothetical protein
MQKNSIGWQAKHDETKGQWPATSTNECGIYYGNYWNSVSVSNDAKKSTIYWMDYLTFKTTWYQMTQIKQNT